MRGAVQIPKPKDWQEFQRGCVVLFSCVLNDLSTREHGRSGEYQSGIDIIGRRPGDNPRYVAIQCRDISKSMTIAKILGDSRKAASLPFRFDEIIFATTLPRSARFNTEAHSATEILNREGIELRVTILGWEDLEDMINRYPAALDYFLPGYRHSGLSEIMDSASSLAEKLEIAVKAITVAAENNNIPLSTIQAILQRDGYIPNDTGAAIAAISRIINEVGELRRKQAASNFGADPDLMEAANAALLKGDLDAYTASLNRALELKEMDRRERVEQQYELATQLAEALAVQGRFDDAIRTMEDAIALFDGRSDRPVEAFTGRWRIALIMAEKGQRLGNAKIMREAIQAHEKLKTDIHVKALRHLEGRLILNCFRLKKELMVLEFRYDDIPNIVPELQEVMALAVEGLNQDVDETRITIWESIFEAGDHADDAQLLLAALNVARLMHNRTSRPIRKSRKERSRANGESFNWYVDTASRLILNLFALFRVDQLKFGHHSRRAIVLAEAVLAKIEKFGIANIGASSVVIFSGALANCTRISGDISFAERAVKMVKDYISEPRGTAYLRALPELETARALIRLQHWFGLSSFHYAGEIEKLEADYRAAARPAEQFKIAGMLEHCGDAYQQAALLLGRDCMADAMRSYRQSLLALDPIYKASPAYASRLRARVWSKYMALSVIIAFDPSQAPLPVEVMS